MCSAVRRVPQQETDNRPRVIHNRHNECGNRRRRALRMYQHLHGGRARARCSMRIRRTQWGSVTCTGMRLCARDRERRVHVLSMSMRVAALSPRSSSSTSSTVTLPLPLPASAAAVAAACSRRHCRHQFDGKLQGCPVAKMNCCHASLSSRQLLKESVGQHAKPSSLVIIWTS